MHGVPTSHRSVWLTLSVLLIATMQAVAQAGQLDPTFGNGGMVTTDFGPQTGQSNIATANAITIQPDGKILVCGGAPTSSGFPTAAVVRYNTDGSLDTGFGTAGIAITSNAPVLSAIALQLDGKVVVTGAGGVTVDVIRYSSNGALDTTFGTGGIVSLSTIGQGTSALLIQSNGDIVVGSRRFMFRLLPNGQSDSSFGSGGSARMAGYNADAMALQSNGKILIASSFVNSGFQDSGFVTRYNSNGTLDSSFGINGQLASAGPANAMAFLGTGEFLIGGSLIYKPTILNEGSGLSTGFAVSRYLGGGIADGKFGAHGGTFTAISPSSTYPNVVTSGLGVQSSGDIVLLGTAENIFGLAFALVRYTPTGQLDTTFGTNGTVITTFGTDDVTASGLVIQSDGKIVAVGSYSTTQGAADYGYKLVRYLGQ